MPVRLHSNLAVGWELYVVVHYIAFLACSPPFHEGKTKNKKNVQPSIAGHVDMAHS